MAQRVALELRSPSGSKSASGQQSGCTLSEMAFAETRAAASIQNESATDKLGSPKFAGTASSLIVAICAHHDDRQIGATLFDLPEQFQSIHARHVDVG
jgi:hypothetical protein